MSFDDDTQKRVLWRFSLLVTMYNTKKAKFHVDDGREFLCKRKSLHPMLKQLRGDIKKICVDIAEMYNHPLTIMRPELDVNQDNYPMWTFKFYIASLYEPIERATIFVCEPKLTEFDYGAQSRIVDMFNYGVYKEEISVTKQANDHRIKLIDEVFVVMDQMVNVQLYHDDYWHDTDDEDEDDCDVMDDTDDKDESDPVEDYNITDESDDSDFVEDYESEADSDFVEDYESDSD